MLTAVSDTVPPQDPENDENDSGIPPLVAGLLGVIAGAGLLGGGIAYRRRNKDV